MKVKDIKKLLEQFDDEDNFYLWNPDRAGHDDAILDFNIRAGFSDEYGENLFTNLDELEEYEQDAEGVVDTFPCVIMSFWK